MKKVFYVMMTMSLAAVMTGCGEKEQKFNYLLDEFADLKIMRYQIPGWDELSLQQKEYAYHLAEAAKWGRDIIWDQNSEHNIELRHTIENILNNYEGDKSSDEYQKFLVYAKRVFFANGIHHHYAEDKFFPECSQEYFKSLMQAVGDADKCELLIPYIYNKNSYKQRRANATTGDIVVESSVNYYDGVNREEVEAYYASIFDKDNETPISYGLNTKVVKDENGNVKELAWYKGGIYGKAIEKICEELALAAK